MRIVNPNIPRQLATYLLVKSFRIIIINEL